MSAEALSKSGFDAFKARIEEIARERLESGQIAYVVPEMLHKELMHEVNRFPVVERFASEVPMLSEGAFRDGIRTSIQRILREDRGQPQNPSPTDLPTSGQAAPSQPPDPAASTASVKEGAEAPVPPVLPLPEPAVVPLVPRGSSAEALQPSDEKKMDPAPLTSGALGTIMTDPAPASAPSVGKKVRVSFREIDEPGDADGPYSAWINWIDFSDRGFTAQRNGTG
ncbi:hypothetical protein C8R46DRAFT_1028964 [Mycena filopes]|nr:hypothetical protein C8R46DRAFT_1028964 [Mycena filopes]